MNRRAGSWLTDRDARRRPGITHCGSNAFVATGRCGLISAGTLRRNAEPTAVSRRETGHALFAALRAPQRLTVSGAARR